MSVDNEDIGVDCDECGTHNNVDTSNYVHDRMTDRGWHMSSANGDLCPACAKKFEEGVED